MNMNKIRARRKEAGNVLFLILIAVALFAALSYAVTQSSRSGGGDANNETNLISSAQVTQYPASVRTAIIRMIVSNGVTAAELEFNPPSDFGNCTTDPQCVFHPAGGGATYAPAPADIVTGTTPQVWVFNAENEINLVGTTVGGNAPDSTTADVIAILPNVKTSICEKINEELGINGGAIPTETADIDVATIMDDNPGGIGAGGGTIGEGAAASLDGQAFGCFVVGGVNYYYHALIEQ
jgi:hypothetical protein